MPYFYQLFFNLKFFKINKIIKHMLRYESLCRYKKLDYSYNNIIQLQ